MHDSASSVSRLCGAYEEARGLLSKHSKMSTQGDYLVLWSDGDLRSVGIDNEYWAIWKEVNKFKTKCEHYAKVQQKKKEAGMIANRPFKSSAAGFTHFLNNRVNWDGVATVKFDNLGKCYFDSAYAVRCYQGYITIKSRVESKVCYLKEIEWRHSDNRSTYKLGQCGYTL